MRLIRFVDRIAKPRSFPVGVELDGNCEKIQFELPQFRPDQVELIYWADANRADVDTLDGGVWQIDQHVTQSTGDLICFITVSVMNKVLWHSADFIARVTNIADIDHRVYQAYPTAIQKAVDLARNASEILLDAAGTEQDKFVYGDMVQLGQVYRDLKPGDFTLLDDGWYLDVDSEDASKAVKVQNAEWSIYSWRPPERAMFRVDLIEKNPSITGVLPMAYRLGEEYFAIDSDRRGETFVADEIYINCFNNATEYVVPISRTHEPDEFSRVLYSGGALVSAQNPYGDEVEQMEGYSICAKMYSADEQKFTIERMEVNGEIATGGVLPMGYIHSGTYWPLRAAEVGRTIEASALVVNKYLDDGGSEQEQAVMEPADFTDEIDNTVFWAPQGVPILDANEGWKVFRLVFDETTTLKIDAISINYRNVFPAGYELGGELFPIDLNEVGTVITADALLINYNKQSEEYSIDSITYTPGYTPGSLKCSINSVTYTTDETVEADEATRRQSTIRRAGLTFQVRRDFEDSIVCTDMVGQCDSMVVFGDSIFAGYMPWDETLAAEDYIGRGVTQQLSEMLGLPMTNYAVPGALLTDNPSEFKTVYDQVSDWTKAEGTTPLVLIGAGTNDAYELQLSNLGKLEFEDGEMVEPDPSTICGALQDIIEMLEAQGVERRHIVICTPIPKAIRGDAELVTGVDIQGTAVGAAMWQVAVINRCNVINGYHSVLGQLNDPVYKEILMPDDTHPSEQGATYYADFICRLLGGRMTKAQDWIAHNVAHPIPKENLTQTGRALLTLCAEDFSLYALSKRLEVDATDSSIVNEVDDDEWEIWSYKYFHGQNVQLRVDAMDLNPVVNDVLPMAYQRIYRNVELGGETVTDYPLPYSAVGGIIETCELLVNRRRNDGALAIRGMDVTVLARRDFENMIVCQDHLGEFDSIVVFGDSIFHNAISNSQGEYDGHPTNSGTMDRFATLMDLPQENNAANGATLSAMREGDGSVEQPYNVWQQVQRWEGPTTGTTPLIMINGGTNDQYFYQLCNMGAYDHQDPIEIFGGLDEILSELIYGHSIAPWQIVVNTPMPKGIRANAYYTAIYEAQLTAIGYAMYEICLKYGVSVINGFRGPFSNIDSETLKATLMPDDTHPSEYGAGLLARYIYNEIIEAGRPSLTVTDDGQGNITMTWRG